MLMDSEAGYDRAFQLALNWTARAMQVPEHRRRSILVDEVKQEGLTLEEIAEMADEVGSFDDASLRECAFQMFWGWPMAPGKRLLGLNSWDDPYFSDAADAVADALASIAMELPTESAADARTQLRLYATYHPEPSDEQQRYSWQQKLHDALDLSLGIPKERGLRRILKAL